MRVALATDFYSPWVGGPATAIRVLSHGLAERGHEVALLAPSPVGAPYVESEGTITVTRVRTAPLPFGYNIRISISPLSVGSWLDTVKPDVLNIHHPFPLSVAALVAARRRGIPVVATNHTIPSCSLWGIRRLGPLYTAAHALLGRWIAGVLNACDVVAAPTATAARLTRDLGCRRPVRVISNGIDIDRFFPGPADVALRARLRLDDRLIVLYTGRLDAEKNMDMWLDAAARVAQTLPVQFVIGGEGTDRTKLESRAQALGLNECVRFIGYVSPQELPSLYRLAAVYFITSHVELQSISTLEATCSGLPVVAVDSGALHELVRNRENGYLVGQESVASAAYALERLLTDAALRASMSCESRKVALSHAAQRTIEEYELLMQGTIVAARGDYDLEPAGVRGT